MKDDIYNRFKRDLTRFHKKGYSMDFPNIEANYDKDLRLNTVYIQVAMTKEGQEDKHI